MTGKFNKMTFTKPAAKERIDRMLVSCRHGRTSAELQVIFCIDRRTVGNYIRYLREIGKLHVSGWTRESMGNRFYPVPIFKTGVGEDAPKPEPITKREVRVRAWAKLKSEPERHKKYLLARRKTPAPLEEPTTSTRPPWPFEWRGKPSLFSKERSNA